MYSTETLSNLFLTNCRKGATVTETRAHYTFTDRVPLSQGYSFERFNKIVTTSLKENLLKDNIFILKNSNNTDYIQDILPQQLRRLDIKEEEFLQQLINKHKLIVDNASTYVKVEFIISPEINNIYSNLYKESFILTPNFEATENDSLVNELNQYMDKKSILFTELRLNLHRNKQTRQAKLAITYHTNTLHTTFPISKFF